MNQYLKNLNKMEFVVTCACTGRCKHCSEGKHTSAGEHIDPETAASAVRRVAEAYPIQTVMAFGGEPLLYPEAVYAIMSAARERGVPRRQVITNGYFSKSTEKMREVAERLHGCGVNDLLLSVDVFHQESIPLDTVMAFAKELKACGIPVRLQPAWLVSEDDGNPYNQKTRELLGHFRDLQLPVGEGNMVFPEGNAKKYLAEYFGDQPPINPYVEDPYDIRCLSFSPGGEVLDGNVCRQDIMEILEQYAPKA